MARKHDAPILSAAHESQVLNMIMQNCAKAILSASELQRWRQLFPDEGAGDIGRESRRAELGRDLGRLNATISGSLSLDVPDRENGIDGMRRGQAEITALAAAIAKGAV